MLSTVYTWASFVLSVCVIGSVPISFHGTGTGVLHHSSFCQNILTRPLLCVGNTKQQRRRYDDGGDLEEATVSRVLLRG